MPRKRHSAEEISRKLRGADVLLDQGKAAAKLTLDKVICKQAAEGNV